MGVVWRATDTTLGRDVAIKVLPDAFARDPERMARFEREARVLASLNHPNIASIYGVGEAAGHRFLAMELVTGDDLAVRLAQGPLPVIEALEIAKQIAEGLEAAHEKGVIHRDLKPANVKLTSEGQAKLLDFGLAKALEGDPASSGASNSMTHSPTITGLMTGANVILGTAAYMSPEQARGKAVDRRADIWAFGCVLFECLTGRRTFAGETVSDTLARILEREPDLSTLPATTPARVRELLQRCLVKDAKLRLRDIGDARIALQEVLASRTPSGQLRAVDAPLGAGPPPRLPVAALVGAGVAGLVAGALLWKLLAPHASGDDARPMAVTVPMPPGVIATAAAISNDGQTILVRGIPKDTIGGVAPRPQIYARPIASFDFKPVPGSEGARGTGGVHHGALWIVSQSSPTSPELRMVAIPMDGASPATSVGEWKPDWINATRLSNDDWIVQTGPSTIQRVVFGGRSDAPVTLDAGRKGVSRYELSGSALPGDKFVFVNVVSYDANGFHYGLGVADVHSGKVRVIEEDGGCGRYSPTGHVVFSRGDVVMAAPIDAGSGETRGAPVAVWSGLATDYSFLPSYFDLSSNGTLFYRPGQAGGERAMSALTSAGKLEPWSAEKRVVDSDFIVSPDGRRVAFTMVNARGIDEVWLSLADHADFQRLGTDPTADCAHPVWTPDGTHIAYQRHGKDDKDGQYLQPADGGPARRILKAPPEEIQVYGTSWLPDGRTLLCNRIQDGRISSVALTVTDQEQDISKLRRFMPTSDERGFVTVAPGGQMVVLSTREFGDWCTAVASLSADGVAGRPVPTPAPVKGANAYQWSHDGKSLYVQGDKPKVYRVPVTPGPTPTIGTPTEIADLDERKARLWTMLPDGRLLLTLRNDNESELTRYHMVVNFGTLVKQKMHAGR